MLANNDITLSIFCFHPLIDSYVTLKHVIHLWFSYGQQYYGHYITKFHTVSLAHSSWSPNIGSCQQHQYGGHANL